MKKVLSPVAYALVSLVTYFFIIYLPLLESIPLPPIYLFLFALVLVVAMYPFASVLLAKYERLADPRPIDHVRVSLVYYFLLAYWLIAVLSDMLGFSIELWVPNISVKEVADNEPILFLILFIIIFIISMNAVTFYILHKRAIKKKCCDTLNGKYRMA